MAYPRGSDCVTAHFHGVERDGKGEGGQQIVTNFSEVPWIKAHIELYQRDPEQAHMWDSSAVGGPGVLPTLLLTTRGRRSGEPRPAPLIYGHFDGSYVVIASKGGMPDHPLWYLNLQADPDCELMVGALHTRARARFAEGGERARLWQQMARIYPPYDEYQQRAGGRVIPVVLLEPVAE